MRINNQYQFSTNRQTYKKQTNPISFNALYFKNAKIRDNAFSSQAISSFLENDVIAWTIENHNIVIDNVSNAGQIIGYRACSDVTTEDGEIIPAGMQLKPLEYSVGVKEHMV